VCSGRTGQNEVVLVVFDPAVTSYDALLTTFWEGHDPTQGMRQGGDVGTQYRSAVFYHTPEQREAAERLIREFDAAQVWDAPIVTEVAPLEKFYPAEDYHQDYFENNPAQPYCRAVVAPKVSKFRGKFLEKLKR
jgi:peptide-methionine (S)-S-oxide reductase